MALDTTEYELALDELLRAAMAAKDNRNSLDRRVTARRLSDATSEELSGVGDLLAEPVFAACRRGMREIGMKLSKQLKSYDGLRDLLIRVSSLDSSQAERRGTLLSQAWVGIDTGEGFWAD